MKVYQMHPYKYRIEFIMGDSSCQYFYSDDIDVIARNLVSFAILNCYPTILGYVLAYACVQTLGDDDEYSCSCGNVEKLEQAFDEILIAIAHCIDV